MSSNRQLFLSEVVSIDAHHDPIKFDDKSAGVYVDLTFQEGRVGGDRPEIPFTFKLNLKRALLTVSVGRDLKYDRRHVARTIPNSSVEHTRLRGARDVAEREIAAEGRVDLASLASAISGKFRKRSEISRVDELKLVQSLPETLVTPRSEGASGYSWILEPTFREHLRGQPWDPIADPRLFVESLADQLADPHILVELKCAFEDIHISDIVEKDGLSEDERENLVLHEVNKKAAEHFLKMLLIEAHLMPSRLDNRFREVVIASVTAIED